MKILLLSTWFPFPPDQGSKIRAYHLLRALAEKHELGLISFQDTELKDEWLEHISRFCEWVEVIPRNAFEMSRAGSWMGWFSARPRALAASYSKEMSAKARFFASQWQPDLTFALTINTAPYALEIPSNWHVVDVDNLLARMLYEEYVAEQSVLHKGRRYLAFKKFQRYERAIYGQFDLALVTSNQDQQKIREYVSLDSSQIGVVSNGVDIHHYTFKENAGESNLVVFTGALTYHANMDAMQYFLRDIFPLILAMQPDTVLSITGSTRGVDLNQLPDYKQINYTGYVNDIREVLGRACLCLVPLRKGAGTRLKILEAMAIGVPVVSTLKGAEGLEAEHGVHLVLSDGPENFAKETVSLLRDGKRRQEIALNARRFVEEKYSWSRVGNALNDLLSQMDGSRTNDH